MDRRPWRVCPLVCVLLSACGRSPVELEPGLIVQVIDEAGNGVVAADVELRPADDEDGVTIAAGRTDRGGVVELPFPGPGSYELRAHTDLRCCVRQGALETSVTHPGEWVVIEAVTGPCPTWTPESCG